MHRQLMHRAGLRRADIDALELVLGRDLLFDELGGLAADFREILAVLCAHVDRSIDGPGEFIQTNFVGTFTILHVRWRGKREVASSLAEAVAPAQETRSDRIDFFGVSTILRSLILFNLLFAIQTVLDVTYLWGNAKLPDDISYASYAHRGAYPLILTALLAAGFVLAAMKPGGPAEQSAIIRPLVYLWVAQNVLLVASSILRLDLYVEIYLLT